MEEKSYGIKQLGIAFVICVALYFTAFYGIEYLRARQGPWRVEFAASNQPPAIFITLPSLNLHRLRIDFPGEPATTNATNAIVFDTARQVPFPVPMGECVFLDTTSLPGTVVLELGGHQIQLLPRVLTVDGREHDWRSLTNLSLPRRNSTNP